MILWPLWYDEIVLDALGEQLEAGREDGASNDSAHDYPRDHYACAIGLGCRLWLPPGWWISVDDHPALPSDVHRRSQLLANAIYVSHRNGSE